jgi:acyl carrier protein
MKRDIKQWLENWFRKNSVMPRDDIRRESGENYLEKGWIDSLAFITLISDIEEQFSIRFSNDEFQDRSFATIDGLTKAIREHV